MSDKQLGDREVDPIVRLGYPAPDGPAAGAVEAQAEESGAKAPLGTAEARRKIEAAITLMGVAARQEDEPEGFEAMRLLLTQALAALPHGAEIAPAPAGPKADKPEGSGENE